MTSQPGGISSVGRALEWHSRGQGFESPILHFISSHVFVSDDRTPLNRVSRSVPISLALLRGRLPRGVLETCFLLVGSVLQSGE